MSDASTTLLDAAHAYTARGFRVVPVPAGRKGPVRKGWQTSRLLPEDLDGHFNGIGNIGLLLGEPSGHLVDVDLDSPEALALADEFLPNTSVVTGRPSSPRSHRWYVAEGVRTKKHVDPVDRSSIVEIRSTGAQTLVGPSVHPSGEPYDHLDGVPPHVDGADLAARVAALAAAVVARRHPGLAPKSSARAERGPASRAVVEPNDDDRVLRRAQTYLDAMPPAISGQGGHNSTYAAATALVHGFELEPEVAFRLLADRFNPRCMPPWSDPELRHKIEDAATKPHERPRGWLRDAECERRHARRHATSFTKDDEIDSPQGPSRPRDPGPLPGRLLFVPGFIDEVMRHNLATATRPQPVLALAAAICLQSVLTARKVRDDRGNRTNVYCVGVAPSGAGKEHARKVTKNVLLAAGLGQHDGNEDIASDAGLLAAVEIEPAILFQIDEFGRFLRTIGDPKKAPHLFNVISALMKLYSSADSVFRGKAYADSSRNKLIQQPCVSVYGTSVPEHFYESLTAESMGDGFVARLLVFEAPASTVRNRVPVAPVPESIVDAAKWWGAFRPGGNLATEYPEPLVVETTADAGTVFDTLGALVDVELAAPGAAASSLWSRAEEKACRLALVYACSRDRERPVIDVEAARWACDLADHLTRRMLFVAEEWVADGQFDARQKRVMRAVRDAGGRITRSDLCRRTQALSTRERQEVVQNLLETGLLRQESVRGTTKPTLVYALAER